MVLPTADLKKDEHDILAHNNHGFRVLGKKADGGIALHFWDVAKCSVQVHVAFLLAMVTGLTQWWPICVGLLLCLLGLLCAKVLILVLSTLSGKLYRRPYHRPLLYWSWWPVWTLSLSCLVIVVGAILGHFLWHTFFREYYELQRLQTYQDIEPALVPGSQIQDAGIVEFGPAVSIDRSRGGCFKNGGATYCVSPILSGGELRDGLADAPRAGGYDFFAVGIDCCDCPAQDFQCGEWMNPFTHGGIRSTDIESRPFYRLAVENWAATYRKTVEHPLFFDWVKSPTRHVHGAWHQGTHLLVLAVCIPVPVLFLIAFLLKLVLQKLVGAGQASPVATPAPPPGFERAWEKLLPEMLQQNRDERQQLVGLPVTQAPWYASTQPNSLAPGLVPGEVRIGARGPQGPQRPRAADTKFSAPRGPRGLGSHWLPTVHRPEPIGPVGVW